MPCVADHIIDLSEGFYISAGVSRLHSCDSFDPESVKDGDLIFVKTDYIFNGVFELKFLDKISNQFNLITGVSSYQLGKDTHGSYNRILQSPKLKKWFCVHPPEEQNEKIIPLPIGFQEPDRPGGNQLFLERIKMIRKDFSKKEDKIFLPYHDLSTNPKRRAQFEYLASLDFVNAQRKKQNLSEYYQSLNNHKFVIGLEGSGPDIHRNYETMLVGSIPINIKNCIENLFSYHGIDGVFLENWNQLEKNKFEQIKSKVYNITVNDNFLNIDYHKQLIAEQLKKG